MAYKGIRVRYILAATAVVSAGAGAAVSHVITKKKLELAIELKYDEIMFREIDSAKKFYSQKYKTEENSDPVKLAEAKGYPVSVEEEDQELLNEAVDVIRNMEYIPEEEVAEERIVPVKKNIFKDPRPPATIAVVKDEEYVRDKTQPYIISHDEFFNATQDYEQVTLSYFEADDVLVGSDDKPVDDEARLIGHDNIQFGHLSQDNNVVYVRNDKLELDFEILRSTGSYAEEVLGFIKHSDDTRGVRKFRAFD